MTNSTKTTAHLLITALAIYFYQDKCQSPAAEQFGSECRWLSWKHIYFVVFSTVRWDSTRVAQEVVLQSLQGILLELAGELLLELFSTLLTACLQKVFPFISNSQAKCHSQPLPQCLPSLKRNNRWLDADVPYLAHFAVVFFFLIMPGYELEVITAALATSLLTEIKTGCFSHYYLLRLLLCVHLLCL